MTMTFAEEQLAKHYQEQIEDMGTYHGIELSIKDTVIDALKDKLVVAECNLKRYERDCEPATDVQWAAVEHISNALEMSIAELKARSVPPDKNNKTNLTYYEAKEMIRKGNLIVTDPKSKAKVLKQMRSRGGKK